MDVLNDVLGGLSDHRIVREPEQSPKGKSNISDNGFLD